MNTASKLATTALSPSIQAQDSLDSAARPAIWYTLRGACLRGAVVGVIGAILLFYPLIGDATKLWADDFDARLIGWIVEWGYHSIFQKLSPATVWDANSFFPHRHSLAFSDSLLGLQPFYAPLRLLGLSPIHALYGSLSGVVILGAIALSIALHRAPHADWQLGEQPWILFGALFSLGTTSFLYHYQLFGMYLAIPGAAFILNYLYSRRTGDLVGALGCISWSILIATYVAPMIGVLILCFLPAILWVLWRDRIQIARDWRRLGVQLLVISLVGSVLYFVQLRPYLQIQSQFPGSSGLSEAYAYSARASSFFSGYSKNSFWYKNNGYAAYGDWERVLFPGYSLLAGVALFVSYLSLKLVTAVIKPLVALRPNAAEVNSTRSVAGVNTRWALPVMAVILLTSVVILSFGPFADEQRLQRLPFFYLAKVIPGLESVRTPGRFGMLLGLPCVLLSVYFVRTLRDSFERVGARVVLGLMLAIESLPAVTTFNAPPLRLDRAALIQSAVPTGAPVIVLPVVTGDHIATMQSVISQLQEGFYHWRPLLVGYGNKTTPELDQLFALDNELKAGKSGAGQRLIAWARNMHVNHLVVDGTGYPEETTRAIAELESEKFLTVVERRGDTVAYSF